MQKEMQRLRENYRRLEEKLVGSKTSEKKEIVDLNTKIKKLETALKETKTKMTVNENIISKKDIEIESLKGKLENIAVKE